MDTETTLHTVDQYLDAVIAQDASQLELAGVALNVAFFTEQPALDASTRNLQMALGIMYGPDQHLYADMPIESLHRRQIGAAIHVVSAMIQGDRIPKIDFTPVIDRSLVAASRVEGLGGTKISRPTRRRFIDTVESLGDNPRRTVDHSRIMIAHEIITDRASWFSGRLVVGDQLAR